MMAPPDAALPAPRPSLPAVVAELRPAEANSHVALTIFKWYRLILTFGLVLMVAATVAMILKPAVPAATARILLKTGSETLPIAGLPTSGKGLTPEILQTEAELLSSRIVLLPVARALLVQGGRAPASEDMVETEVASLRSDLVVVPVPNTTVIQARKFASTVAEAERHLTMIIDSYVEQHATAFSGSTSLAGFLEREGEAAAARLREAEDHRRRWQEANNVVALEEQVLAQLAAVAEYEGSLKRLDVEADGTRAQLATLTRNVAALPPQSVTSRENTANPLIGRLKGDIATEEASLRDLSRNPVTERIRMDIAAAEAATRDTSTNPTVIKLKADLVAAEVAMSDLRQRYTDEDRRVQEKLEQIARLQQGIADAERDATAAADARVQSLRHELSAAQRDVEAATRSRIAALRTQLAAAEREGDVLGRTTTAPTPLRESLNREVVTVRTRLTTLDAQRDGLRDQLSAARTELASLQGKRVEAARTTRDVEMAKAFYEQNMKRLDDARLSTDLRKQQLRDLAVIEPPRGTIDSPRPMRIALVALLGGVVGLGLGVATALALEFFNWSLRTPEDVEFYLGVPVLASVPAITSLTRPPRVLPSASERTDIGSAQRAPVEDA